MIGSVLASSPPCCRGQPTIGSMRGGPDMISPVRSARPRYGRGDGRRLAGHGRWPFASGCPSCRLAGRLLRDDGGRQAAPGPDGKGPLIRASSCRRADGRSRHLYAGGLKGTGSHHIAMKDTVVPGRAHFFDPENGSRALIGPLYQAGRKSCRWFMALSPSEWPRERSTSSSSLPYGRQQLKAAVPMRESESFQYELGRIAAGARAAEAFSRSRPKATGAAPSPER